MPSRGVVQVRVTPKTKNPFTIKALSISGVTWKWHVLNHALTGMVGQLIVGEDGPWNDIRSHGGILRSGIPRMASVSGLDGAPRRDVRQREGPLEAWARPALLR